MFVRAGIESDHFAFSLFVRVTYLPSSLSIWNWLVQSDRVIFRSKCLAVQLKGLEKTEIIELWFPNLLFSSPLLSFRNAISNSPSPTSHPLNHACLELHPPRPSPLRPLSLHNPHNLPYPSDAPIRPHQSLPRKPKPSRIHADATRPRHFPNLSDNPRI